MVITLLVFALILFFLEIFLPGGVLAIIGILCILGASAVASMSYGWLGGLLVFILGGLFVVVMFFIEVKWLLRSSWAKQIQHNEKNTGSSLKKVNVDGLIGLEAEALTRLTPSGRIRVDGRMIDARSEDGWISKGEAVIVTGSDVFHAFVRRKT